MQGTYSVHGTTREMGRFISMKELNFPLKAKDSDSALSIAGRGRHLDITTVNPSAYSCLCKAVMMPGCVSMLACSIHSLHLGNRNPTQQGLSI